MITEKEFKERCAEILRKNITFSHQVGNYVIHGALDELWELHTEQNSHKHSVMQAEGSDEHICKYCGVLTSQPDEDCYKNPNRVQGAAVGNGAAGKGVCDGCEDIAGFYLGTACPKCSRPFRQVK